MRNECFGDYMTVAVFFLAGLFLVAAAIFTARFVAPRGPSVLTGTAYESGIEPIGGGWNQSHIRYCVFAPLFLGVLAVGTGRFQRDAFSGLPGVEGWPRTDEQDDIAAHRPTRIVMPSLGRLTS